MLAQTGCNVGLNDVSLNIGSGEIYVIMGLSGSGKSTLVRHFNRLIEPTAGEIVIDGSDVIKLNPQGLRELRRYKVSMVFQNFGLLPHQTVLENTAYALRTRGEGKAAGQREGAHVARQGGPRRLRRALSGRTLGRHAPARGPRPGPRGRHRRAADGRGVLALDPLIRTEMQDQLLQLQATLNKTIVFITHDLDEALRIGNRIAILRDGTLVQEGTPDEILTRPGRRLCAAFRGAARGRAVKVKLSLRVATGAG